MTARAKPKGKSAKPSPRPPDDRPRCDWPMSDLLLAYHDTEWGTPARDDRTLFEFLALSGIQAGLSWEIVLTKRAGFRRAFANFQPEAVARFNARSLPRLLRDESIVRNRLKLEAVIHNARRVLETREEFGSFGKYLWNFVDGQPIVNRWRKREQCPARTELSDRVSDDLRERGFKFVGSTICYAFLQTVGIVNDHLAHCFRHEALSRSR